MFPESEWNYQEWSETTTKPPSNNPRKEALLKQSVELLRGERDNSSDCLQVTESALEAGFYQVAFEAVRCNSKHSEYYFCRAIEVVFEDPSHWPYIDESFVVYCEDAVAEAAPNEWVPDSKATTLAKLGRYRFFTGKPERAIEPQSYGG